MKYHCFYCHFYISDMMMAVSWEKTNQENAANAAKLAPSTDLTSKQKTILQFSESI